MVSRRAIRLAGAAFRERMVVVRGCSGSILNQPGAIPWRLRLKRARLERDY